VAVARRDFDDDDGQTWHNRTSTLVGVSVLAILVIGILILAATAVARQFGEPEQAPLDFVAPTYSATSADSATASTTTQTITSTSPPETTDIDPPSSTSTTSSSSETSSTRRTTTRNDDDEDDEPTTRTTRQRPRTNVTRTLNPFP
jgi:cytoskeletal protein RodZ